MKNKRLLFGVSLTVFLISTWQMIYNSIYGVDYSITVKWTIIAFVGVVIICISFGYWGLVIIPKRG